MGISLTQNQDIEYTIPSDGHYMFAVKTSSTAALMWLKLSISGTTFFNESKTEANATLGSPILSLRAGTKITYRAVYNDYGKIFKFS